MSKVKVKPLKKFRNTFIPVYIRYTHSKPTQKVGGPLLAALSAAICSLRRLALCAFIVLTRNA